MSKSFKLILASLSVFIFTACIGTQEVQTSQSFPYINNVNKGNMSITVFAFKNYTDTPQAGQRAANLMEGLLSSKGYRTVNRVDDARRSMNSQLSSVGTQYILVGGVSEWRYKTGIDGEPAISLQMKLIDRHSKRVLWSATGSDNNWGNASIGTTAQGLFEELLH